MSKEIRNDLEKLKDVQIPNEEGEKPVEQNPETPKVEQKTGFVGRVGMKLCELDEKTSEKKLAKKQALEAKKAAKAKKKTRGKIIAGVAVGAAVLGAIGKAVWNVAANANQGNVCGEPEDLVELDDSPVENPEPSSENE